MKIRRIYNATATAKAVKKAVKTATESNRVTFADLLRGYEEAYRNRPENPLTAPEKEDIFANALLNLATAVAHSVINKCIDPSRKSATPSANSGCSPTMIQLKRDIFHALANINAIKYATENATALVTDAEGNAKKIVTDRALYDGLMKQLQKTLPDGYDLVHDAVVAIMEETRNATERGVLEAPFLEVTYNTRRLKKRVYIRKADSVGGYEEVQTAPIREVYKSVRRAVANSRAIQTDPRNGYTYIEDYIKDGETDRIDRIYYRSGKYEDIGSYETDSNGRQTHYTADLVTFESLEALTEKLLLTPREYAILKYRMKGYGNKAIATYLGITENSCKGATRRLREKAVKIGLTPKK